jgi:hypothetical protein
MCVNYRFLDHISPIPNVSIRNPNSTIRNVKIPQFLPYYSIILNSFQRKSTHNLIDTFAEKLKRKISEDKNSVFL